MLWCLVARGVTVDSLQSEPLTGTSPNSECESHWYHLRVDSGSLTIISNAWKIWYSHFEIGVQRCKWSNKELPQATLKSKKPKFAPKNSGHFFWASLAIRTKKIRKNLSRYSYLAALNSFPRNQTRHRSVQYTWRKSYINLNRPTTSAEHPAANQSRQPAHGNKISGDITTTLPVDVHDGISDLGMLSYAQCQW
jgi:hypothetical protein